MCKNQSQLRGELKSFGLNPAEWTLRKLPKQRFKVVHVTDSDFYFVGETRFSGPRRRWTTLILMSI